VQGDDERARTGTAQRAMLSRSVAASAENAYPTSAKRLRLVDPGAGAPARRCGRNARGGGRARCLRGPHAHAASGDRLARPVAEDPRDIVGTGRGAAMHAHAGPAIAHRRHELDDGTVHAIDWPEREW
jgi:hypothetical protein